MPYTVTDFTRWLTKIQGTPVLEALPPWLVFPGGRRIHVMPYSGDDNNNGQSPERAVKTLVQALSLATADQNDVVILHSESNTAANTTDYQSATLDWNKDCVHLIGCHSGNLYNQRSRIAWLSTAASASDIPLMTVSADNCYLANFSLSVGSSDANLSFGLNVTGDRNRFDNIGVAFPTNAVNDCAGAYALKLDGASECLFNNCRFGSFTTDLGTAANSVVLVDTGISATEFQNCHFMARIEHATNSPLIKLVDANSVGFGGLIFENCIFRNISVNFAYTAGGVFKLGAVLVEGRVYVRQCASYGASKWDVDDNDNVIISNSPLPVGDTAGLGLAV